MILTFRFQLHSDTNVTFGCVDFANAELATNTLAAMRKMAVARFIAFEYHAEVDNTHPFGSSSLICYSSKREAFLRRCYKSSQSKSGGQDRLARIQSKPKRPPRAMNWLLF